MDENLSSKLFGDEVIKLRKVMNDWVDVDNIQVDDRVIFVNLPRRSDKREFLLRINCNNDFPLGPADYIFVNPDTKNDDGKQYWPVDDNQSFKVDEPIRWICIVGTREYKNKHSDQQFNSKENTLSKTVFHIFRQINGWKRQE